MCKRETQSSGSGAVIYLDRGEINSKDQTEWWQNEHLEAGGSDEISQMWLQHFKELFNCTVLCLIVLYCCIVYFKVGTIDTNEDVVINSEEVRSAPVGLDDNKACGTDKMTAR